MYRKKLTIEEMELAGLFESDLECEILPDNQDAVAVFQAMDTQWNIMVAGDKFVYMGLNYQSFNSIVESIGISKDDGLFLDVQTMERTALKTLNSR